MAGGNLREIGNKKQQQKEKKNRQTSRTIWEIIFKRTSQSNKAICWQSDQSDGETTASSERKREKKNTGQIAGEICFRN